MIIVDIIKRVGRGACNTGRLYTTDLYKRPIMSSHITTNNCTIKDCEKPARWRGLCCAHYRRWERYGDPLGKPDRYGRAVKRFWSLVEQTEGCWIWNGRKSKGYGQLDVEGRAMPAHRFSYELLVGPIPEGMHIDHLCRNHSCVNPQHLEPVTNRENIIRGIGPAAVNSRKTKCPKGHDLVPVSWMTARICKQCKKEHSAKWWKSRGRLLKAAKRIQAESELAKSP